MSDRALQDDVIRALADAAYRASPAWRDRRLVDPERFERYARFVARHYYRERVVHFFKYSRALARVTGRRPEAVLDGDGFEALLPTMVVGGRDTAREVARLVATHVTTARTDAVPYLDDLVCYESAMMVAEAGPRVWRDGAAPAAPTGTPVTAEGTTLLALSYDLPAVLPRLLEPWDEVPRAPARPTTLLVARSPHGRVAVARSTDAVAAVLAHADGSRPPDELAARAGLDRAALDETLRGLLELGAVRFSTGS